MTGGVTIVGRAALIYDPADPTTAALDDDGAELRFGPLCFEDVLRRNDEVVATLDHNAGRTIGETRDGNLKLWCDARGLLFEVTNPDPAFATRRLLADIGYGLFGASHMYVSDPRRTYDFVDGGKRVREVCALKRLVDVAVVGEPRFVGGVCWLRPAALTGKAAADFDSLAELLAVDRAAGHSDL